MVENFLERSKPSATNAVLICISHSMKKSAFAENYHQIALKKIQCYLEEKTTNSHIDQLDKFEDTINSRVN